MKKFMMFMVAVLAMSPAFGQPVLTKGMECKRLSTEDLLDARYLGVQNNLDAWIMEGKKHVKQVVLTDVNLEPVSIAPVAGSGDLEVIAASVTPSRTGLLLVDRGKKHTVVLRGEVDAESRVLVENYDTVVAYEHGRKDVCMVWGATSPTGLFNALVTVLQMNDTKQYKTYVALFDSRMQRLWEKEYPLGSMSDLLVTDDGRVVTFGIEPEEEQYHMVFNVLDSLHSATYNASFKCEPIHELHLVNVLGNHAVAMGTYRPAGKKKDKLTAGVLGLSFDLDSAALTGITIRPFQNEDMNIFLNKKTKKIQKEQVCERIVTLGCLPTAYGAVIALGRDMTVEKTSSSGSVTREGYGTGIHLAAVDTTGRICWVRNLRRNDKTGDGGLPMLGITTASGKVCVVKSEHPKMPLTYELSDEAKQFKQGDKGNLVVYTVEADGSIEKLLLEKKSKHTVFRALSRNDGTLLLISEKGKKTRMAELQW